MFENLKNRFNKKMKRNFDKKEIDKKEMKILLDRGAVLIDVRSPQEYREGHLNNAILLPEYELLSKHKLVFKSKEEIIVLYCSNGARSKKARKKLEKIGYTNVYNLLDNI